MKNTRLVEARKNLNLTQEELAKRLNTTKGTISNWENEYSTPTLETAFQLCSILNQDINTIFYKLKVQDTYT